MKKVLIILALLLCLAFLASAETFDAPKSVYEGNAFLRSSAVWKDGFISFCPPDEALFVCDENRVFHKYDLVYDHTGYDEEVKAFLKKTDALLMDTEFIENGNYNIAVSGDRIFLVHLYTAAIYEVTLSDSQAHAVFKCIPEYLPDQKIKGIFSVENAWADDEKIYINVNFHGEDGYVELSVLNCYDLQSFARENRDLSLPGAYYAYAAYPYKEGKVLLQATTGKSSDSSIVFVKDLKTGEAEPLSDYLSAAGLPAAYTLMTYDDVHDSVIIRDYDLLYAVSEGRPAMPFGRIEDISPQALILKNGQLFTISKMIQVFDPTKEMAVTHLSVLTDGTTPPNIARGSNIPDIEIDVKEAGGTVSGQSAFDQFANDMTIASSRYDIYIVPIQMADNILDKGYYVPIESEKAKEMVESMHPFVRARMADESGSLAILPIQVMRKNTLGYDVRAAELLGLTEDDLPKTYAQLFEFIRNFDYDYGDLAIDYDISLFKVTVGRAIGLIRQSILQDTIALSRIDREKLIESRDEIARLLDDTMKIGKEVSDVVTPYFAIPQIFMEDYIDAPEHLSEPAFLFTFDLSPLPSSHVEYYPYKYLTFVDSSALSLTDALSPVGIYSGLAMVVNPYSEKIDYALRYIDYCLENMEGRDKADLLMNAEPVPSGYMQAYESHMQAIERNEKQLEYETGKERRESEEFLEWLYQACEGMIPFLYDVDQNALDIYEKDIETASEIWLDMDAASEPINAVFDQFLRGSVDGRQLIDRILEVSRMVGLE